MTISARWILIFPILLLGACGGLVELGPQGPAPQVFTLSPLPRSDTQSAPEFRVLVEPPMLSGALDSQRIAVRRGDLEISYLAGARWEDATPQLLRRYLVRSLDNQSALAAVGEGNLDLPVDTRLRLDLRAFNATTTERPGRLRIEVAWVATLLAGDRPEVLASRYFKQSRDAASDAPATLAAGFNTALDDIVGDMAQWIESEIGGQEAATG